MSDALFLPRELFAPAPAQPGAQAAVQPSRGLNFVSGEAVAADLLKAFESDSAPPPARPERRRKPRPAGARGVEVFVAGPQAKKSIR